MSLGVAGALSGDPDTALRLDGASGFVDGGVNPVLDVTYQDGGLTLEAWINPASFPGYATIISKLTGVSASNYTLDLNGSTFVRYTTANGQWSTQSWPVSFVAGIWHHLVLTHAQNGTLYLWVDGVRQASRTNVTTPVRSSSPVGIGSQSGAGASWPFNGFLDEVAIYGHVLSDARIQAHYANRSTAAYRTEVLADAPLAYWRFGEPAAATAYALSGAVTTYGDTGRAPSDRCRFHASGEACAVGTVAAGLQPGTTYNYRVIAHTPGGDRVSNCVSSQLVSGPVRGMAGDLWADVVLGQPDFGQNVPTQTNAQGTLRPGGILIDHRQTPNRVYVGDILRNRVLGFASLGHCPNTSNCTADSDCSPGPCSLSATPTVVIGQPGFVGSSACNGDGTGQIFPAREPASASSLCLIPPLQISIAEVIHATLMDTDANGALYVPDTFNHRILKYDDPFVSDTVADEVWGQADFSGNECNRGGTTLDCRGLCLGGSQVPNAGVAIDDQGSLWVADAQNARVLRFPRCGAFGTGVCSGVPAGTIAKDADIVLGQPDCQTAVRGSTARPLNQFAYPLDVAFDAATGTLYVDDTDAGNGSRILSFQRDLQTGDFQTGMTGVLVPLGSSPPQCDNWRPIEISFDDARGGLWLRYSTQKCTEMADIGSGTMLYTTTGQVSGFGPIRGMDVDSDGDLFLVDTFEGVYRFRKSVLESGPEGQRSGSPEKVFAGSNQDGGGYSADSFTGLGGAVVFDDPNGIGLSQLVVADNFRMLMWNGFDLDFMQSGAAADDLFGEPAFDSRDMWGAQLFSYPQVYGGQLWVHRQLFGVNEILVFDYPFTQASLPVRVFSLTVGFPVLGFPGQTISVGGGQVDFAVEGSGDALWIADRVGSRVVRVNHLTASPTVDFVLGQADTFGVSCNRGNPAVLGGDTLCAPYNVSLDVQGNLYVTDNGMENGTNRRLLEFDSVLFSPGAQALFGISANRVLGTGGDFTASGLTAVSDPFISPFDPTLFSNGILAVGNNPYDTQRFPVVYQSPLDELLPQFILGDYTSYPSGGWSVDRQGNLYLSDSNWSRLLIYRAPMQKLDFLCGQEPKLSCRVPQKSRFVMARGSSATRNRLVWSWVGANVPVSDFGDPTTTTDYALCVYDSLGGVNRRAFSVTILPGGNCAGRACWRGLRGRGYRYKDRHGTAGGLIRLVAKSRTGSRARIVVRGRGARLQLPALPLDVDPAVTVQLVNEQGACWEAAYSVVRRNLSTQFRAVLP